MPTLPDELEYSFKPAPACGDFQGRARYQSKSAQTRDIGQIEIFKRAVVRNVQEYVILLRPSPRLSFGHISTLASVFRWFARGHAAYVLTESSERVLPRLAIPQEREPSQRDSERAFRLSLGGSSCLRL